MKRETTVVLSALVIVFLSVAGFALHKSIVLSEEHVPQSSENVSPYDGEYSILGKNIPLKNKTYQHHDGSVIAVTRYFGNEKQIDLNADGVVDRVFLLVQERNDNKSQYFVTGIVSDGTTTKTIPTVPLGISISPQTIGTEEKDVITVNYAIAGPTLSETIGETLRLKYDVQNNLFGIVANNFEGEADPAHMSLTMKSWVWQKTITPTETILPIKPGVFALAFSRDGTFGMKTDCNGGGGEYVVDTRRLTLSNMISTMMFCEGSQESIYRDALSRATEYVFTSRGQLLIRTSTQEEIYFQ
jgi:heat shock protein HslJ